MLRLLSCKSPFSTVKPFTQSFHVLENETHKSARQWLLTFASQSHAFYPAAKLWSVTIMCRYRIFGFFWWSLEWWGAQCYFWAVVAYNTSSIATIVADCVFIKASVAVCHGFS